MDADDAHPLDGAHGLDDIADDLYGLLPEGFTAERDARAARLRREGGRELAGQVKALRRPSVAAWLVNALVRHRPDDVDGLLTLGETLRRAQAEMDAGQLRELGRQRQGLVAAVGRQARGLARDLGRPVTDPVVEAVEETLRAALSDAGAAAAVRSGRLTAALSYAGFGEVDLSDAVATPRPRPLARSRRGGLTAMPGSGPKGEDVATPQPPLEGAAEAPDGAAEPPPDAAALRRAQARAAVDEARSALAAADSAAWRAVQHRDSVARRAATAEQRVAAAQARIDELEQVIAEARVVRDRALSAWTPLDARARDAAAAASRAQAEADHARAELARALAALDADA